MIDNSYSRRKFIRKYLYEGTIFFSGALILGNSMKAIAQEEPKPTSQDDPNTVPQDVPKSVSQEVPKGKDTASENDPCDDLTDVSPGEIDKRKKLAYVIKSPIPDSNCSNCALHLPPAAGKACGGCLLFKGPVRPEGHCAYWAPINK